MTVPSYPTKWSPWVMDVVGPGLKFFRDRWGICHSKALALGKCRKSIMCALVAGKRSPSSMMTSRIRSTALTVRPVLSSQRL